MKSPLLSKTIAVGALEILSAVLLLVSEFLQKAEFSPVAYVLLANGVVMIVLRFVTKESVGFS